MADIEIVDENDLIELDKMKNGSKETINKIIQNVSTSSATKQLIAGTASGWVTGYVTMKVGRTAAFAIGGSIILYQIAQNKGYTTINWEQLNNKMDKYAVDTKAKCVEKGPGVFGKIRTFAKGNNAFSAGFVGGFLLGLAT